MSEQTEKKKPQKTRWPLVIAACIITILILYYALHEPDHYRDGITFNRTICGIHISSLGQTLMIYANDHNDLYPDANKWCDILMKVEDFSEKVLKCPDDKVGPCSFAMNPNCKSALASSDFVLLFETKPGWNQHGGPELLNPNNHFMKGCNILFNDGHVQFVEPQDFNNLKWK